MGDDDRQMKYIETGVGFTNKVAQRILENLDGEEREQQLDAMREVMRDYIKMENEYKMGKKVLGLLKKGLELENADMNRDVEAEYRAKLGEERGRSGLTDLDLSRDPRLQQLETMIAGGGSPDEDMEVAASQTEQRYIDPWSRKEITENPVRNRKCGHVYDRATVEKFLEQYSKNRPRKELKCPVVGCGNREAITMADLVSDPELTRKVARQARGV